MLKNKTLTYISLFSCAGVGCFGFKKAGFECIATNELIERRINVQKFNDKCKFDSGYICDDITTEETKNKFMELIDRPYIRRVSFLGGECLAEQNLDEVLSLIKEIRISLPEKTIWLYTGFRWNYIMNYQPVETDDFDYIEESYNDGLMEKRKRIISLCDVVIDGEYIDEQKDLTLAYRGSKNQHVIDVKQSLAQNKMVLYCD